MSALFLTPLVALAETPEKVTPREALKPFNDLVGAWKGTGIPEGSRSDKDSGWWSERLAWQWQFKGDDAWLIVEIAKGKYYDGGELRYLPDTKRFRLTLDTVTKEKQIFEGELADKKLVVERKDEKAKETQRLTFRMLHNNRITYQYDVLADGKTAFAKKYQVGMTKEGVAFASGTTGPECIVSGGLGTMQVSHQGKTYYVCCSGCRDEFKANPDKYIKEFEAKKKKP
jgi:ribosomal protein L24E